MKNKTNKEIKEGAKRFVKESLKEEDFEGMYKLFMMNAPEKTKKILRVETIKKLCNVWFTFGRLNERNEMLNSTIKDLEEER